MKYAPIIIPTLCRSKHLIRLIESLKKNEWAHFTEIYVSLDYPPSKKYEEGWREIKEYLVNGEFSVFAGFHVLEQSKNLGWVYNMWYLCDFISEQYDRWIYLEDDGEVSPNFIEYIDKCLERYEDDSEVYGVCGYNFPVNWKVSAGATCLKQNVCAAVWGMGLWREKYQEMRTYIKSHQLLNDVDICLRDELYKKMIDACIRDYLPGALSPARFLNRFMCDWTDMSMRAFLVLQGKYCISPIISKVRNWGFDGTGCSNGVGQMDNALSRQEIDSSGSFDLVEDSLHAELENRNRLNDVDRIPSCQLVDSYREIWLYKHFGLWVCQLYATLWETPKRILKRDYSRLTAKML